MAGLLAHEWLEMVGGSENVFEQLTKCFPDDDLACLWNDAGSRFGDDIEQTWLAATPLKRSKLLSVPFMPLAWRKLNIERYERVIVSSHAFAHHLAARAAKRGIPAFAYVHTPARYLWSPRLDVRGYHWAARLGRNPLRALDRATTSNLVRYAANSEFVRERIRRSWGQDADVIYPPVDVEGIKSRGDWRSWLSGREASLIDALPEGFILGASRMVPYKRLDAVIRVGQRLKRPVVIAGDGPDEERLRAIAKEVVVPVHFVGRPSDDLLLALYQAAALFVFLAIEDFGIMPVEAMAAGTPVLVNQQGGAREAVESVGLGVAVDPGEESELVHEAQRAAGMKSCGVRDCSRFSAERFRREMALWTKTASSRGQHV